MEQSPPLPFALKAGLARLCLLTKKMYPRLPQRCPQPGRLAGNLDIGVCSLLRAETPRNAGGTCVGHRNEAQRMVCRHRRRGMHGTALLQEHNQNEGTNGNQKHHCSQTSESQTTSWKPCQHLSRTTLSSSSWTRTACHVPLQAPLAVPTDSSPGHPSRRRSRKALQRPPDGGRNHQPWKRSEQAT